MKCQLSEQAYQWKNDDGSYGVGKLVQTDACTSICTFGMTESLYPDYRVLIASSYTRELEFIEFGKLSQYPASPIEQPKT